jgi:Secretion system C-terminal sorting domain
VVIAFQKPYNTESAIVVESFYYNSSSNSYAFGTGTTYIDPDAYSVNANPAVAVSWNYSYLVTWTQDSSPAGINYAFGYLNEGSIQPEATGTIAGTEANSLTPSIYSNKDYSPAGGEHPFTLAFEEYHSNYNYSTIEMTNLSFSYSIQNQDWEMSQTYNPPEVISSGNYPQNRYPSVVEFADLSWAVCFTSYVPNQFPDLYNLTYIRSSNPSINKTYGMGVQSGSANLSGDYSGYVTWSQNNSGWSNQAVTAGGSSPVSLNTSGQYVQMCNGDGGDSVLVSSYYNTSSPYYFNLSQTLGSVLGQTAKSNTGPEKTLSVPSAVVSVGRGVGINKGMMHFYCDFGGLTVDGQNIGFVNAPDSLNYGSLPKVDSVLESQPFQVGANSRIIFTESSGFADSAAALNVLGDSGYVRCKAEIVDNSDNKVIGTVDDSILSSQDIHSGRTNSYQLGTDGISGKTVYVKIAVTTNLDSIKTVLVENYSLDNPSAGKSTQSLSMTPINVIKSFTLYQNYPNPFNPTTVISYTIPRDGMATLKVYDVLGREVETLVNQNQKVGRYEVTFDGSRLASGVYFYRLVAGNHVITKKMLMLK